MRDYISGHSVDGNPKQTAAAAFMGRELRNLSACAASIQQIISLAASRPNDDGVIPIRRCLGRRLPMSARHFGAASSTEISPMRMAMILRHFISFAACRAECAGRHRRGIAVSQL